MEGLGGQWEGLKEGRRGLGNGRERGRGEEVIRRVGEGRGGGCEGTEQRQGQRGGVEGDRREGRGQGREEEGDCLASIKGD